MQQMIKAAHDHVRAQDITHLLGRLQSRQGQSTGANAIQYSTPPQAMDTTADARVFIADQLLQEHPHPQVVHGGNKNGLCASATNDTKKGQTHVNSVFNQLQSLSLQPQLKNVSDCELLDQ